MSNNLVIFDTNACSPSADNSFGPLLAGYCHGFDFTLLFEQGLLTLVPTLLFLILGPIRLIGLHKASIKTLPAVVGYAKFIGAGVLVALQLALVVLWAVNQPLQTRLSVPSAALSLVAAMVFLGLSYIEHARSVRPSTLLNSYLLFSLILDIAQVRTLFLRTSLLIGSLFVTTMGVKFVLLLLEARSKRAFLKQPHNRLPGETISGIFNRTLFWWLNPLFLDAFRNPIAFDNLPEIDIDLSSSHLGEVLEQLWQRRSKPESRFTLFWITNRALLRPLLSIIFPRMALIGFNFAQPFLINRVLSLLSDNQSSSADWTAYGLIAATGFTYLGIAISTLHFQHALYRYMSMFRGALVTLIYRQTLSSRCDEYDESSSLTLMSSDIDRIVACFQNVHAIWARTIEVGIGTTLLILQLGWVSVIPLVVVGLSSLGNSVVAKMIGNRQKRWMQAIQRRVAITGSILTSMKSIKMMGLTETVSSTIQNQRIRETKHQASYRWMIVWLNLIAQIPLCLAPVVTFAAFALLSSNSDSNGLSITKAFTVLSIITLTTGPAEDLLGSIPAAASALGSYDRVQNFLLAPSREDQRIVRQTMQSSGVNEEAQGPLSSNKEGVSHGEEDVDLLRWGSSAIVVRDATVRPASDARPVIKNICFSVDRGSIFTIMGPVGAGKTTLVKALLGELSCDSGDVCVLSTKISYCAQYPWLSNCTIKQNICGPEDRSRPIDEEWYSTVIQACALNIDMSRLPHGDRTIAGSKGTTLSGGQKQRVALARALYSRNDIFIFDDVFSALDISTQRTTFEGIFGGNGILRKLGSTAIVVTHTTRFLPFSDKIIILDANGNAVQSGTYSVLRQQTDFLQNIELQSQLNSHNPPQEGSHNPNQGATSVSIQEQPPNFAPEAEKVAIYRYYLRSVGWARAAVFAGFAAVAVFASSFSQVWLNWWVKANGDQLGKHIAVYFVLSMVQIIGQGACNWSILVMIAPSTARKIHLALLKTVMRAPQSFFDKTDPGSLLNRFSQDMTLIETPLSVGALFTVFNGFTVIAQAGLIVSGSYYMTATLPLLLIVIFLLQKFYLRTSRQLQILDLEARSPLYSHFLNTIDGTITLRAFGWQEHFKNTNIKHVDYSQRPYYLLYCIQRWLNLVLDLIIAAMAILVVTLSLNLRGTVNPGLLGISLNNILAFNTNLQSFITGWTQLETSLSAVARVRHLEASTEREDTSTESREPPCNWPQRGSIVMKNLTAGYNSSTPTFRNVNLTILPGQKVGICGRTGSGKSTLLSTVLRLINPMSGDILVDDISLLTLPHDTTRARLLTIPQDGLILPGSVRFNVDPMGHYSDNAIIQALEKVQLWPIILANRSSLPGSHTLDNDAESNFNDALEAPLHEKSLSAGQVQLLALARVLLRKDQSRVLLLDEATSSVDVDTEKRMWNILRSEFRDHTILHIAHRLDTLLDADLVAVMDQGQLVEVGEPGALLRGEVGTGVFKQLVGR